VEDLRPLGHNARVQRGGPMGRGGEGEEMEMPATGINVKTEVRVDTTERLFYNDRLFRGGGF